MERRNSYPIPLKIYYDKLQYSGKQLNELMMKIKYDRMIL